MLIIEEAVYKWVGGNENCTFCSTFFFFFVNLKLLKNGLLIKKNVVGKAEDEPLKSGNSTDRKCREIKGTFSF